MLEVRRRFLVGSGRPSMLMLVRSAAALATMRPEVCPGKRLKKKRQPPVPQVITIKILVPGGGGCAPAGGPADSPSRIRVGLTAGDSQVLV